MTLVYYPPNPEEGEYLEGWKVDKAPEEAYFLESIEDLFHADEGDETFVLDANDVCRREEGRREEGQTRERREMREGRRRETNVHTCEERGTRDEGRGREKGGTREEPGRGKRRRKEGEARDEGRRDQGKEGPREGRGRAETREGRRRGKEGGERRGIHSHQISALIVRYCASEKRWYLLQADGDEINIFFNTAELLLTMFPWNPTYTLVKEQGR
jgi:hypothetical protein